MLKFGYHSRENEGPIDPLPRRNMDATLEVAVCANSNTPLIEPKQRTMTSLDTGFVPYDELIDNWRFDDAFRYATHEPYPACLRIGDERPYYEVSFKGVIVRALCRPLDHPKRQVEFLRSYANSLTGDGWLLQPPNAIPNTPRALISELQGLFEATLQQLVGGAYSIAHWRRRYGPGYPSTMTPEGMTLRQVLLARVDGSELVTLYETPEGVDADAWSQFLDVLDNGDLATLVGYVCSSAAVDEQGGSVIAQMREALRLRYDAQLPDHPSLNQPFLELFPRRRLGPGVLQRVVFGSNHAYPNPALRV
jgi:hypothetical protein